MLLVAAVLLSASDPLPQEQAIADDFVGQFHIASLPFTPTPPHVQIVTTPALSYYDGSGVHEARFRELPDPVQAIFNRWAKASVDEATGNALFDDMFYRFFFVHELGHWATSQVMAQRHDAAAAANLRANHWQVERECNRISVAWWREHDPAYLARLIANFRKIEAIIPDPVPAGQDAKAYFAANYQKLGDDPNAYAWFLLRSVIDAYDEPPQSFQQVLDDLATQNFG